MVYCIYKEGDYMKKLLKFTFLILLIMAIISVIYIVYEGYTMYREAVNKYDITRKIDDIRSSEGYLKKEDIPVDFTNAILAIEDRKFYEHGPVSFSSILRATITNIQTMKLAEGGSTITQQLAKNLYFTYEKKFSRKVAEVFVANKLEKQYSKDEILEIYCNLIYFGNGNYGVNNASKAYFKKSPKELDLYEITMLAGIPNAPSVYSLDENKDLAKKRQDEVIAAMVDCKYITYDQASQVKKIQEEK